MIKYSNKAYCLYQDIATGEWCWRGRWYEEYPAKEIEEYEQRILEEWEMRQEERRLENEPTHS